MVNYTCPRCGYEINIKKKYCNHLRRKTLCENKVSDDDLVNEYIKFNITEKLSKISKPLKTVQNLSFTQNTTKIPQNPTIYHNLSQFNTQIYECKYCFKKLSRKDSLDRHLKKCKAKIVIVIVIPGPIVIQGACLI